jgi:hypothetical protein
MNFDFVVFDEIQTMVYKDPLEIQTALKHYMEFGEIKGFNSQMTSDAGVVLLGNIEESKWNTETNMMMEINPIFRESATLDRFHGFIEGWMIPRMGHELIADGWALSTEYFTEVLHSLRSDLSYAAIVSDCLDVPQKADQRDLTAIKRLTEAFLKLLFPHVRSKRDISPDEFITYCLEPAKEMRRIIKKQLAIIDPGEFGTPGKRDIPDIQYNYRQVEHEEEPAEPEEVQAAFDDVRRDYTETVDTSDGANVMAEKSATMPTAPRDTRAQLLRYGYKAIFQEDADFFVEWMDRYQEKQKIARELIQKRFPPPQMSYDKFTQEIDSWGAVFTQQINKAKDILSIASERTPRIDEELERAKELTQSIATKIENLAVELAVNLNESGGGSSIEEIEALMDDMQRLVESVNEYE